MNTNDIIKIQGLNLKSTDIEMIKSLIISNPSWHRTRLSKEICELWNWKRPNGSLKDMACRTMLLKLEKGEYLKLPKLRRKSPQSLGRKKLQTMLHSQAAVETSIQNLYPIQITEVSRSGHNENIFDYFLFEYQ